MGFAVQEGALFRFHHQVNQRGAAPAERGKIKAVQDARHLRHGEAHGIGRRLAQFKTAIRHSDGRRDECCHGGQISRTHQGARLFQIRNEHRGKPALIEIRRPC